MTMNAHGFKERSYNGSRFLILESRKLDECMRHFIAAGNYSGIWVNRVQGYTEDNLDFLTRYAEVKIEKIEIQCPLKDDSSVEALYGVQGLKAITFGGSDHICLNFSRLKNLEFYRGPWHAKGGIEQGENLNDIGLWGFRPSNVESISGLSNLRHLMLVSPEITDLRGIASLINLSSLNIVMGKKLVTISGIESRLDTLREVMFEKCKLVKDMEKVSLLQRLKILGLIDCGSLASLSFVNYMPSLEDLRFVNTDIIDGDMTPCLRLKNAGFLWKKHYSHRPEEIKKETERRNVQ